MAEQAYAYVTLIPVAKGFQGAIQKQLGGLGGIGTQAGSQAGGGFVGGFKKALGGVAIAGAAATAALGGVLASGFSRLSGIEQAQAKLVGLGNSTEDVAQIMDNALSAVRGTAFGMADAATIAASAVAAGVAPGEELAYYLKTVADSAYIAGAGLDEMGSILNKATTTGKAGNDVLTQLAERGIPIYQMLAEQAGVAATEVFDLASEGQISSEMLMTALSTNLGGAALQSGNTVAGAFANMNAAIQRVGANLLGPSFGYFKDFFLGITALLGPVEEKAKVVGQVIADFLGEKLIPYFSDLKLIGETLGADNVFAKVFDDISAAVNGFFSGGGLSNLVTIFLEMRQALLSAFVEILPELLVALSEMLLAIVDSLVKMVPVLLDAALIAFTSLVDALIVVVPTLIQTLVELIPKILTALLEAVPQILNAAITFFMSLVDALIQIIPVLIDTFVGLIPQLVSTVLEALPQIIDASITLFTGLIDGLVTMIPELLTAIIELIPQITNQIVAALPQIIEAAILLFTGLLDGLLKATPQILTAVIGMIPAITGALMDNIPKLVEAGVEIVKGLVKGIVDNAPRLLGMAVSSIGNTLVNGVKSFLGIQSPSRVFAAIGEDTINGFIAGIDGKASDVMATAEKLGNWITKSLESGEITARAAAAARTVVDAYTTELSRMETEYNQLGERLQQAQDGLATMIEDKANFVANLAESLSGLNAISVGDEMTWEKALTNLNERVQATEELSIVTGDLVNLGLNDGLLKQIVEAGAVDFAKSIIDGGAEAVEALNTMTSKADAAAIDLASRVGGILYDEGIAFGEGLVAETEASMASLSGEMSQVAQTFGSELDKAVTKAATKAKNIITGASSAITTPSGPPAQNGNRIALAEGGLVTGPTNALVGEAGPEVVIPLDRFENMMGLNNGGGKTVNYYAAPNQSIDSEASLFQAMNRAKVVANW
jgi:tape measure domain-containing protein